MEKVVFGKFLKTYFIATALAPICLSLSYVTAQRSAFWPWGALLIGVGVLLALSVHGILHLAKTQLEVSPLNITKAKSADKDVIGFFVAYVLPMFFAKAINIEPLGLALFVGLLAFVIWGTHSIQVNPLLGVFGYHFYEVDTQAGISFLLITKRKIVNVKSVKSVVQLTEYLILDRG
jgi:hypothetical protein